MLAGNVLLDASKGQFVKLEPGIAKLLGILSLQALPRRISLDFRDVFSEGFTFDTIIGALKIDQGVMTTENFRLRGPSARVVMGGRVDLARETQTLRVRVTPHLSDSVSLAGALIGAALLAAAAQPAFARNDDCEGNESLRLVNGRFHTMDARDSVVNTVVIQNGRFAAVGPHGMNDGDRCTRTVNLRGRTVVPGIIDNHNHIVLLGLRPGHDARLEHANSIAEALATLTARASQVPAGEWITSIGGFSRNQFFPDPLPTRFPTIEELSSAVRWKSWLMTTRACSPRFNSITTRVFSSDSSRTSRMPSRIFSVTSSLALAVSGTYTRP